ncbi:divalent-cation tolerance protein CutA [Thermus caldilimi]|uniref:divalent-cation tolerance protein CutA n=1 Tax=Thermus caldilimi TaxID=2483360 RepID=UPI0010765231|nr:divalent-cation tolerance protein CutA [Thermus caldilimi]
MEEVVLITAPSEEVGRTLARTLVEEGLAACVNLVPGLTSIYRWQGEVVEDREVLLIVKTTTFAFSRLKKRVLALHPYRVPEILALPVAEGHQAYLDWLRENVG